VLASTKTHKLTDGTDFYTINPLGYVPVLELDDGSRLREGPAIVQYIADQVPEKKLAPPNGTLPRYHLQEWLTFIGTELHKGFSPLFNPSLADDVKQIFRTRLTGRFQWVDGELAKKPFLMGEQFSVADITAVVAVDFARVIKLKPDERYPHLLRWRAAMAERPSIAA
jgi:glutathione S-transferase